MQIYFLTFHSKQKIIEDASIGGAYVNCWIEARDIKQSEKIGRDRIEEFNWEVLNLEDVYEVTADDYPNGKVGFEYYNQAQIDKWVLVFHTYPAGEGNRA